MKRKTNILILSALMAVVVAGCGSSSGTSSSNAASSSSAAVSSSSAYVQTYSEYDDQISVNNNIVSASDYYQEAAPAENTGMAEGSVPADIPEGNITDAAIGQECTFTESGTPAYTVTIDSAAFTDRRSALESETADQVILITYSFHSLTGTPVLVDDMSFRLSVGDTSCQPYYLSDQIVAEPAGTDSVTAEIAYAVPTGTTDAALYVVDNSEADNENYRVELSSLSE